MLSVVMQSVVMQSVVMPSAVMPSVVGLNVVAPLKKLFKMSFTLMNSFAEKEKEMKVSNIKANLSF